MSWVIAFAKALPIVMVTVVLLWLMAFAGSNSKAIGLAAAVGVAAEGLIWVGFLNVVFGLILWRVMVVCFHAH